MAVFADTPELLLSVMPIGIARAPTGKPMYQLCAFISAALCLDYRVLMWIISGANHVLTP